MKAKVQFLIMGIISIVMLISCQSKEEKAAELIKNKLSKTLYDFESYQPIETTVTEAKMTMFNDSVCWKKAATLAYGVKEASEYMRKADKAEAYMNIWGKPSYYSSSYSDNQYYKYMEECGENLKKVANALEVCKSIADQLKEQIAKLDTAKVIGWEAIHRFRCRTRGGNSTIGNYRYVLDKDFKTIILQEDMDEETDIRETLKSVANGDFYDYLIHNAL